MNRTQYKFLFENYQDNIRLYSGCAGITFVNNSATTVYVNNFPIAAGASLAFEANENELDVTEYQVNFAGSAGDLWVIKKIYL